MNNTFRQLWEIEIPYFPKRILDITLYNRNGVLEIVFCTIFKGIKGIEEYKEDWFLGKGKRFVLWKIK